MRRALTESSLHTSQFLVDPGISLASELDAGQLPFVAAGSTMYAERSAPTELTDSRRAQYDGPQHDMAEAVTDEDYDESKV